jgi:hypothetical protein
VCETESVFVHVTVVPTATLTSSGVYAAFPNVLAPTGIDTDDDGPPGVGDGVGDGALGGDEESPPQAIADIKTAEITARRNDNIRSSDVPNFAAPSNIPKDAMGSAYRKRCSCVSSVDVLTPFVWSS